MNATGLTVGSTYLVRVYDYYAVVPATTTFNICVTGAATTGEENISSTIENSLAIYPNPVKTNLNVSFTTINSDVSVSIFNVNGQVIFTEQNVNYTGQYKKALDLGGNAKGIYFLKIITDKQVVTRKIVLE
jgi:hypothetical protein